jgi:hypothetical protein
VLLVPATVVRLERPLAHWNDSGTCLEITLSTNPLIDLPLVQVVAVDEKPGFLTRAARNGRLTPTDPRYPAPVDRANQSSPDLSTKLWTRSHCIDDGRSPGPTTYCDACITTPECRPPDTPEVSPRLPSLACG